MQPLQKVLCLQVFGQAPCDSIEHNYVLNMLKEELKMVNNHLKGQTNFVGKNLTIVDIYMAIVMVELEQAVLETNFRNSMQNINNLFKKIVEMPEFIGRMGKIKQGKKHYPVSFESKKGDGEIKSKKEKNKGKK